MSFVTLAVPALAASLGITKIGAFDTGGKRYAEWWYTGVNPTLVGTSGAGADVKIMVDTTALSAKADASGNWFVAVTAGSGDHTVSVVSGSESYAFKLHLGQDVPANLGTAKQTTGTGSAVPVTGFNQLVGILFSAGVLSLAYYFYIFDGAGKKKVFEKRFLDEK